MSKRPFQSTNSGYTSNSSKKPKQDFDNFRRPIQNSGNSNVLKNQNNVYQYQNQFKQNQPSTSNFGKPVNNIPRAPPVSIADKDDLMDPDDDEIFIVASQKGEEEERKMNERRQQMSEELNMTISNFSQFLPKKQPTSTQITTSKPDSSKNIGIQKTHQDSSQLQQKENFTLTQTLNAEKNKTKALEIQLRNQKQGFNNLQEKLTRKEGENSNLRREKKTLEQEMQALRIKTMRDAENNRNDQEKEKLLREINNLRTKLQFKSYNESVSKISQPVDPAHPTPTFFTNFSQQTKSQALQVSRKAFDIQETPLNLNQISEAKRHDLESREDVVRIQLKLAQVSAMLLAGGHIEHALLDTLFHDAVVMIFHICDYIDYLEVEEEEEICYDSDPGLTACAVISTPMLREKLTTFDPIDNVISKDEGFLSLFQSDKLYEEELCSKPRRIIACIASIARSSRVFSEKLLLENVFLEDADEYQSFVRMLINKLISKVTESKRVYDYWGFAMASASLLASLGSHYESYNHNIIDDALLDFLRSILECRCDSPIMMKHISEFLVFITENVNSSEMIHRLCNLYPREEIVSSKTYKYSHHPEDACIFQVFTMYLLTAFNFESDMTQLEYELLLETAKNLNKTALNMQATKHGTLKFLQWNESTQLSNTCSCLPMLINSLIFLNHQALSYRSIGFNRLVRFKRQRSTSSDEQPQVKESKKCDAMKNELARSSTAVLANLFNCIDSFTDFPIENLVFSNRNEQICSIIKRGVYQGIYNREVFADPLETINIVPNVLKTDDDDEEMDIEPEDNTDHHPSSFQSLNKKSLLKDTIKSPLT